MRLQIQATKKRFFVDAQESSPNRKYHKEQTAHYLKRERLKHQWYQMDLKDFEVYVNEGLHLPEKKSKVKKG